MSEVTNKIHKGNVGEYDNAVIFMDYYLSTYQSDFDMDEIAWAAWESIQKTLGIHIVDDCVIKNERHDKK